jgi:predicted O-methyltransferase YrrM
VSGRPRELLDALPDGVHPVAIGPREGAALGALVRAEQARTTLETGLGFAVSTLWICDALLEAGADAHHVAVEPHPRPEALERLADAGVSSLVELVEEPSELALPRLLAAGRRFDVAFVDGNHRFEGVFLDLVYAGRLVRERGAVFVDDVQLPAVARAVEFCVRNLGWRVEGGGEESASHAWQVLRTGPAAAYARPFDAFADFG